MKKQFTILSIGILLLSMVVVLSSCKKKSSEPEAAAPTFLMSSIPDPADATRIDFQFKCITTDVKLTKVMVTDPLASGTDTYDLQGAIALKDVIYQFGPSYLKATGRWTFQFTGNRTSDGSGFVSGAYLTVSK